MKKLNRLFAILIAVLGVGSLSAQTWTQSGEYYLYNESSKTFLSRGASWGTQAVTDKYGVPFAWDPAAGSIKFLDSDVHLFITSDGYCFTDNNSTGWTCVKVNESTCRLRGTQNRYLKQEADGVLTLTTKASEAVAWTFKTPAERNAIVATYTTENYAAIIQAAGLNVNASKFVDELYGSNYARKDMTSSIGTAKFSGNAGSWTWTGIRGQGGQPAYGTNFAEVWQATGYYSQRVSNLPSGIYKLTVNGFHRQGGYEKCNDLNNRGYQLSTATLEGNGQAVALKPWVTERTGTSNPNNTGEAVAAFNAGKYNNEVYVYVAEDGILDISVNIKNHLGNTWVLFNNFTLTYFSDQVNAEDASNILALAESVSEKVPNAIAQKLAMAKNTFSSNRTIANYNTLTESIEAANTFVAPYASLKALVELCTTYAAESYSNVATVDVRTKFTTAIATATNNGNAATTIAALDEVYSTLETARQVYVKTAIPTTGNSFDMTFLMTNPQVTSATGWINGGTASGQQYTGAPDETYLDFYQVTRDMYQTLSGLPSGSYSVKAATRGHAEVTTGYIYVQNGENKLTKDIHKVGNEGNTLGNGWDWTTTDAIAVTDGHLTIGFYAECGSGQWVGADVFSLYRAYDASLAAPMQASVTSLKSDAQALVGKVMGATENAALIAAIDGANASSTNPFALDAMIIALSSAIADAEVSISDYEKIATYIAKANSISTSIAASYQIQYTNRTISESAERVYQNLEVATYNYVTTNFTYPVELEANGWVPTGPVGSLSGQHYDGTSTSSYLEQSGAAWGSDAWEISYKYEKTLPAGKYVFKVAGRRASGTGNTMSLQVTDIDDPENPIELGSVSDFPEGDTGLGINKKGEASFDANDVAGFALDGQGRGWQWRYVKFELDSETTVQVAVNAAATTVHQWMSFCEATVQMTEETYLEANKGGLDAPTAAANALVDTKPMGTEENNALKAALAMTYNTGAGLLAKVNALETAVANAKAWVAVYYEAKAPLVAQLERFEADFNLEGDIDHAYMKNGLWSDVIEKVKVAALAKDDLTSHEVLTEAANNLQATLDAAQASIDAYNALKIEIKSAKNYTPIVTENVAGHTADLGEAESGYNNASIETARANELTAALQNYRVEDYNYVVENFGEIKLINEWTGQTNTGSGEHWSGNGSTTYFDNNRWNNEGVCEATYTISLPAGQYFLVAAGRAADVEGTEAYIKVGDTKAIFPAKSNYGRGIATDGTATFASYAAYARDNEGNGWEYRFIAFSLNDATEVTLVAGMSLSDSWDPLSWAGVCTPTLYTTPLVAAKENLKNTINHAQTMYPVGDGAFQVDANCDAYQSLSSAISTAQGVLDSSDNIDELEEATESLNEPIENYKNGYVLNAPAEGMAYNIVMSAAWEHDGKAVTYLANDRKDQGLYNIKYHEAPNVNYAQAFTFTAVEGKTNCFTLSMNDVDGNQRYVCTGVPYEGDASQIRTTTDAAQALVVKVIATTREGIYQLWNTEAENYLGGQDAGFFTVNSHTTFRLQEAAKANVTLTLSKVGWATLILPFNAELPEGVKAYSCGEADGETLTLVEAESIKANTPYLMNGYQSTHNFSGYGLADKNSYTDGLFVGTYENYKTTANSNTYVLQKKGDEAAFYLVGEGEGAQPTVGAYRCYMVYEGAAGAPKFSFGRGQGTTSIDNMESTDNGQQTIVIYDLMGRKVETMEKGGMYIVNGKKVVIK